MNTEMYDNTQTPPQEQPRQVLPPPTPQAPPMRSRKSPALATVLSLMPGLGQVYIGYYQQGFINAVVVAIAITMLSTGVVRGAEVLVALPMAFFWMYNMIDANRRAFYYNRVAEGLSGEEVPDEFTTPAAKGSMPVGVALVVVGTLFLLDLNTDFSMAWIEDWWPMILVGGGVWLIVKARQQKT